MFAGNVSVPKMVSAEGNPIVLPENSAADPDATAPAYSWGFQAAPGQMRSWLSEWPRVDRLARSLRGEREAGEQGGGGGIGVLAVPAPEGPVVV